MNKIILFGILISISGCRPSIERQAKHAAAEYCSCIKESLFSFDKAQELFIHCNLELQEKYRLLKIYFIKMDDLDYHNSLSKETKDSIEKFMTVFRKYSDSCGIPVFEKPRF